MAAETIEQQRAQDAWACVEEAKKASDVDFDKYVNVSKGLPALIMNSGLMQVLAFANDKQGEQGVVAAHLRRWLSRRFPAILEKSEFRSFMSALMEAPPQEYQAINSEALAWLKWLRQLAAARKGKGD